MINQDVQYTASTFLRVISILYMAYTGHRRFSVMEILNYVVPVVEAVMMYYAVRGCRRRVADLMRWLSGALANVANKVDDREVTIDLC